ncbi:hypothetical protein [Desulfofalx alkaliphila]|uniref:hypothetical protein n=1 Tax=Desulfofalx alkaliphila TaxID=105483 RepID=UPI0004E0D86F|nr:hypothetical protein [Desulfofalx alkaliphila]
MTNPIFGDKKDPDNYYYHTDPTVQLLIFALSTRPEIEVQLRQALNIIQGVSNTVTSLRRGIETMNASMLEASRHIYSLSPAPGEPKINNGNQVLFNDSKTIPIQEKHK